MHRVTLPSERPRQRKTEETPVAATQNVTEVSHRRVTRRLGHRDPCQNRPYSTDGTTTAPIYDICGGFATAKSGVLCDLQASKRAFPACNRSARKEFQKPVNVPACRYSEVLVSNTVSIGTYRHQIGARLMRYKSVNRF